MSARGLHEFRPLVGFGAFLAEGPVECRHAPWHPVFLKGVRLEDDVTDTVVEDYITGQHEFSNPACPFSLDVGNRADDLLLLFGRLRLFFCELRIGFAESGE